MTKRKVSHMNETELLQHNDFTTISNYFNGAEKLAWKRKHNKLDEIIESLRPYEEEIIKIYEKKQAIMDRLAILRKEMVETCVHPYDMLIHKEKHVTCKFCNSNIYVKHPKTEEKV